MAIWDFLYKSQPPFGASLQCLVYPTPPRPTSAARDAGLAHIRRILSRLSRLMKSSSRRKGTVEDGGGFGWWSYCTVTGANKKS